MSDIRPTQHISLLAGILTLTGILVGLLLALLSAWADYEASSYGFMRRAQAPLRGLSCPVFIGKNERRAVTIKVFNPTDRTLSPGVWTEISTSNDLDSKIDYIKLAPGEQMTVQRQVGPENIDLGQFIFVDAFVYSAYPIPDRQNTCGILVLPVQTGAPLLMGGTILSTLFMVAGLFLFHKTQPARWSRSIFFMVAATFLAMLLSFLGWWMQATIIMILVVLTLTITGGSFFRN